MTRALLAVRFRSAWHRVSHAGVVGSFQALLLAGGVVVGAAYEGNTLIGDLLARAGSGALAWPILREWIFIGTAVQCLVVGYGAMQALLRPPDAALLLSLPVGPGPRYATATVDVGLRYLAVPLVLLAFAAPLAVRGESVLFLRAVGLIGASFALSVLCSVGVSALAGRVASSTHARGLKELLANKWVMPDSAPFLYAPAAGGGLAAFLAVPLQVSLDDWPDDPRAALIGVLFVAGAAAVVYALGAVAYARGFARLGPALENLDARYPLSPNAGAEGTEIYGMGFVQRFGGLAGAVGVRDLFSLRRRHRAEPLLLLALGVGGGLLTGKIAASPRAWDVAAVGIGLFAARLGVRLGDPDVEVPWLTRWLPIPTRALLGAKAGVAAFHAAHAVVPFAIVAAASGAVAPALVAVGTAAAACVLAPALALAWPGGGRAVYLPLAAALCFLALALSYAALATTAGLAAVLAVRAGARLARGVT